MTSFGSIILFLLVFSNTIHFSKEACWNYFNNLNSKDFSEPVTLVQADSSMDIWNCTLYKYRARKIKTNLYYILNQCSIANWNDLETKCATKPDMDETISAFHLFCLLNQIVNSSKIQECTGYDAVWKYFQDIFSSSSSHAKRIDPATPSSSRALICLLVLSGSLNMLLLVIFVRNIWHRKRPDRRKMVPECLLLNSQEVMERTQTSA